MIERSGVRPLGPEDAVARDEWYAVAIDADVEPERSYRTRLLGVDIELTRDGEGAVACTAVAGGEVLRLPVELAHHHLWTTLGSPAHDVFAIPEADDEGRRFVSCGRVTVRASGLRIVENFLDMAHFPFVHTDILGEEAHPEVKPYRAEIRRNADEVWATECVFRQPQAALASDGAVDAEYQYRVPAPYAAILYKTSPNRAAALDLVGIFVQPRAEALCDVFPFYMLFDDVNSDAAVAQFEQMIFLQDKSILENQIPATLPLSAGAEIPTRADALSIAYRRWLKAKGLRYGTTPAGAEA